MKKLFTTPKFKRRNTKRSLDAIRKMKKRKKRAYSGISHQRQIEPLRTNKITYAPRASHPIVSIKAPDDFSLINNTEELIQYFNQAHDVIRTSRRVNFDISKIKTLTPDAIAVHIAKINDSNFILDGIISGNEPLDQNLRQLFVQSGFYEYVRTRGEKPINDKKILIHKITNNRVEPDIAKNACLLGLMHSFNSEDVFEALYEILIEIMQNTNNHAGNTRGKYDWWLHVYTHPNSFKTSYTFLDLGVGIFDSLPFRSFKKSLLGLLKLESNLDLVPKLFAGEIKSRTSRPERGKGIPQVYECSHDPRFEKFILISNDVYADLKNNKNSLLKIPFKGTLYYWELNQN